MGAAGIEPATLRVTELLPPLACSTRLPHWPANEKPAGPISGPAGGLATWYSDYSSVLEDSR